MTELATTEVTAIEVIPALPLDQNPAAVYLATLRPVGRKGMTTALNTVASLLVPGATALTLPWQNLRYQHTAALRSQLAQKYKPATANQMLAGLRRVLLECKRLGLMSADDYSTASDVKNIKGESLPRGRALARGEVTALLTNCANDPTPAGARDAAMLVVLVGSGLRRSELVALELADYAPDSESLTIRGGKGGKDRMVYLAAGAAAALADWLDVRGNQPGALFNPINKGGKVDIRQMAAQAVFVALAKRARLAGVQSFSPHDLRRTFISDLLDAGADIATVQKLAGHAQVTTTARYDRRGEQAKKKAASLLHVPYQARRKLV